MAAKLVASALLVLYSTGAEDISSSPQSAEVLRNVPDDTLALLQASVEVKKGQAKAAKEAATLASEETEPDYGGEASKASCMASDICGNTPLPASFKIGLDAGDVVETRHKEKIGQGLVVEQKAPAETAEEVAEMAEVSRIPLGTVLQGLACLLIMDVLRRSPWKGKTSKSTPGKVVVKASSQSSPASASVLSAALAGDKAAFEAIISACASQLTQVDNWGCTVLHYAAKGGSAHIVKRLVDMRARVNALDAWDETPLHLAARSGHTEACETLIASGATVDSTNAEECTPLIVAGRADHEAVCTLLIGHGAGITGMPEEMVPDLVTRLLNQQAVTAASMAGVN